MKHITWKIGGEAGFGIMVSGMTISQVLHKAGYSVVEITEYPSLIRGGHNTVAVTIGNELHAQHTGVDILVALNRATIDLHKNELQKNAIILFDGEQVQCTRDEVDPSVSLLSVPFLSLAKSVGGDVLMRNTVALGASIALLGVSFEILADILNQQFARKGEEVVQKNQNAGRAGFDYVQKQYTGVTLALDRKEKRTTPHVLMTGTDAVAAGAIAAGMKFFAAYPMTPINALLALMAKIQEKWGFVYKQPEDEIAAINMAIGASFAGVRSMVATSGGGFALMVEGTSFAGMIEQPVVIIMGMRPGPATGLPTWTGQADLQFILSAGHGEFPRIVLAPGDIEEAFHMTREAFNLADYYQTPAFLLIDKYLFETRFSFPQFSHAGYRIDRGKLLTKEEQEKTKDLARYQLTDDGISPRGIPGRNGGVFRANSDEHNEEGYSEESAENTKRMVEKRMKKQMMLERNVPEPKLYGPADAKVTLVGWGSTKCPVRETLPMLAEQGIVANYIHLSYINPFPTESLSAMLAQAHMLIDIEGNHNAQMAELIRQKTGVVLEKKILRYDGRPLYPEDITAEVKKYVQS